MREPDSAPEHCGARLARPPPVLVVEEDEWVGAPGGVVADLGARAAAAVRERGNAQPSPWPALSA